VTRWGIGPRFALLSVLFSAPLGLAAKWWRDAFTIHGVSKIVLVAAGCVLLAVGVLFCTAAMVTLHRGFAKGELFTSGAYGWCRHPIYASWVVFLVPGVLLLVGSWLFCLVPVAMYAALRLLVRREEEFLEATFGAKDRAYRERVPAIVPFPRMRRRPQS